MGNERDSKSKESKKQTARMLKHLSSFRKIASAIALAMMLTLLSPSVGFLSPLTPKAESEQDRVISVALGENGSTDWYKYIEAYSPWDTSYRAWCAIFVWYCGMRAGISEDVIGYTQWAGSMENYVRTGNFNGTYYPKYQITPQKGDLVYFDWNLDGSSQHVEFVVSCDGSNITTVGGNQGDEPGSVGVRYDFPISSAYVLGFERPNYSTSISSDTEAPKISNAKLTNNDKTGYTIELDVTDNVGVSSVTFPTWPSYKTSEGCTWYQPTSKSGNHYTFKLTLSDFYYYAGSYSTHIYAEDAAGNKNAYAFNFIDYLPQNLISRIERPDGHIYEVYDSALRWTDAKDIAKKKGGHLLTINNNSEELFIKEQVLTEGGRSAYWLGATDGASEGSFKWTTGESFSYTAFESGQPDNASSVEHYLGIWKKNGLWNDFRDEYYIDAHSDIGYIVEYEPIEPTEVGLSFLNKTLTVGDTATLTATVSPSTATDKTITWSSNKTSVATVSSAGVITAVSPGTATITATASNGVKNTCFIQVNGVEPTKITLNSSKVVLAPGETFDLVATVLPENATDKTVTWSTDTPNIVSVSSTGKVTGLSVGNGAATATCSNGVSKSVLVFVRDKEIPLEGIKITGAERYYYSGDTVSLVADLSPKDSTEKDLTWSYTGKLGAVEVGNSFSSSISNTITHKEKISVSVKNSTGTITDSITFYAWPKSGYCNTAKTARFEINPDTGELKISGTGAIETDGSSVYLTPWSENSDIKTLTVEKGITDIDEFTTFRLNNLANISLPEGLTFLPSGLLNETQISKLSVPATVTSIDAESLKNTSVDYLHVYFSTNAPKISGSNTISCDNNVTIHVPSDAKGYENWEANILYDQPAIGNTEEHEHTYKETKVLPTCEKEGKITYTCSECGEEYSEPIEALGHKWDNGIVTKEATETEEGEKLYTCLNDSSHTKTEIIPKLTHTHVLQKIASSAATCTEDGNKEYYVCSTCKNMYSDIYATESLTDADVRIPAIGHDWGNWIETVPATYSSEGLKTRVCLNDSSHTETEVIPKLYDPYADTIYATQIMLESSSVKIGSTTILPWSIYPENASRPKIAYESSDTSIATVTNNGVITGVSDGKATITMSIIYPNGKIVKGSGVITVKKPLLKYRSYVQKNGWMTWKTATVGTSVKSNNYSGTTDDLRMETIQMKLSNIGGGVKYRAYCAKKGWTQWADTAKGNTYAGTKGEARRVEMIQLKAYGQISQSYDIYYRTYCEKFGWLGWAKNNEKSGSAGYARKLEAFQIQLVKKGTSFGGGNMKAFYDSSRD